MAGERTFLQSIGRLRFSGWWTSFGFLLIAIVVYASLAPISPSKLLAFPESDKIMHFLAYAGMMFWFGQIYPKGRASLFISSGFIILGALLEVLQGLSGYRTFEYLDMSANALGVISGFIISRTRLGRLFCAFETLLTGLLDRHADNEKGC